VKENQQVKAGAVLFKLDQAPFQIALDQANAALSAARLSVEQLRVNYTTAQAKLAADQQTLVIQQRTQARTTTSPARRRNRGRCRPRAAAVQQAQAAVTLDQQAIAGALAALNGDPNIKTDDHPS